MSLLVWQLWCCGGPSGAASFADPLVPLVSFLLVSSTFLIVPRFTTATRKPLASHVPRHALGRISPQLETASAERPNHASARMPRA